MTRPHNSFSVAQIGCAWVLLFTFLLASCGNISVPEIPSIKPPSEDEETKISREFRREAKKHLKFVRDPEVERYIERLGRRILAAMGPHSFDYRFFVIEDSQLNAFAVPGGSIYLYTGLIERAKTTDEVAGVLGHEIVHIKGRHMARNSGPDAISILSLVGMLLLARSGAGAQAAGTVGQAISATRQIAYSRQLEMEADTLGARYVKDAGFNPKGVVGFLKTMDEERALNPIDIPEYMLTHPISRERVANAELLLRSLGPADPQSDQPDPLKRIQTIIRMQRSDRDRVVAEYADKVKEQPNDGERLHLLGFAQLLHGKFPEAEANLRKASQQLPNSASLQRDLGRLYARKANFADARKAYDRALELEPKEALTYLYLGELLEQTGDLRGAAGAYLNAQNLSPLWDKPPHRLGLVYGKLDRLGDGYYYLGRSLILQDEDEKATGYLEKAMKIAGSNSPRGQVIKEELNLLRHRSH